MIQTSIDDYVSFKYILSLKVAGFRCISDKSGDKTHLESALKGKVKRSKESATAFQVQNICSRALNIWGSYCDQWYSYSTTVQSKKFFYY